MCPANDDFPVLDGIAPSWADLILKISPTGAAVLKTSDVKSINTGVKVEIGEQRAGGRLMKRTTGDEKSEASITFYQEGWQKLLRALKDIAPKRGNQRLIGLVPFDVQMQFTPPGSAEIFECRLKGCRTAGRTLNPAEGTEANTVEVPVSVTQIADVVDGVECVML